MGVPGVQLASDIGADLSVLDQLPRRAAASVQVRDQRDSMQVDLTGLHHLFSAFACALVLAAGTCDSAAREMACRSIGQGFAPSPQERAPCGTQAVLTETLAADLPPAWSCHRDLSGGDTGGEKCYYYDSSRDCSQCTEDPRSAMSPAVCSPVPLVHRPTHGRLRGLFRAQTSTRCCRWRSAGCGSSASSRSSVRASRGLQLQLCGPNAAESQR